MAQQYRTYRTSGDPQAGWRGITLMELLIVVVVMALLILLAYPAYLDYARKARRAEAQRLLLSWSINQEIFRSNNSTYAADDHSDLPAPTHDDYAFSTPAAPTASTYTLQAGARNDQLNDSARDGTSCTTLTLDQSGTKSPAACWD